jgi:hypothetical protein
MTRTCAIVINLKRETIFGQRRLDFAQKSAATQLRKVLSELQSSDERGDIRTLLLRRHFARAIRERTYYWHSICHGRKLSLSEHQIFPKIVKRRKKVLWESALIRSGQIFYVAQWKALIEAIRQRGYTGKLTFAALHEDYDKVEFWDALDYIGIDAYFELTRKNAPPLADVIAGTNKLAAKMAAFSEKVKKPIVFTEIGYNNLAGTAFKPWYWSGNAAKLDNIEQAACYHAMLAVMSRQKWLAGMFWWTWYPGGAPRAGEPSYSPQSKLAELILESYYGSEH